MEHAILVVFQQALVAAVALSAPAAAAALVVGLAVGIVQTATQVQEQTLSYLPKLVAVALALVAAGPWMLGQLVELARTAFEQIAASGSW